MASGIVTLILRLRQLVFCVGASARALVEDWLLPSYLSSSLLTGTLAR